MNIAFITLGFTPQRASGLDISGERLVKALLDSGHHVTVFAGRRDEKKEDQFHPKLKIYRLPIGNTDWIGYTYRLDRYLARPQFSFDVVHFWDIHFAWAYRGKYVASLHQSFNQRIMSLTSSAGQKRSLKKIYYSLSKRLAEIPSINHSAGLLAVSKSTMNEYILNYQVSPERVLLTPHGIDTEFLKRYPRDAELLNKFRIASKEPILLFVGFITPRKNLELLAKTLPLVRPIPKLLLAGSWISMSYREKVLSLFGDAKTNVIETGFIPDDKMPALYSLADIYVSTSSLEGFGLPMAESLACETPVIALDSGSASEVVGPGGLIVSEKDPEMLAMEITKLLHEPDLRANYGLRGREHIKSEFTIERMRDQTLLAYARFLL
jgi:glycosyltransferase involved in cell wall biosynthesis